MAETAERLTTQRAYTLRLRGRDRDDRSWRAALWTTHETINRGARAFGDWLLTLRGGLDHDLADSPGSAGAGRNAGKDSASTRRNRRILLALSWLTVEDDAGAPIGPVRVATGRDGDSDRARNVLATFGAILRRRGVPTDAIGDLRRSPGEQPGTWIGDCAASLSAAIRSDAVWVNRSELFDDACARWTGLTRANARLVLEQFFGSTDGYLALPTAGDDAHPGNAPDGRDQDVEFREVARGWLSFHFGAGTKSDAGDIGERLALLSRTKLDGFVERSGTELAGALAKRVNAPVGDDVEETLAAIVVAIGWKGRPSSGRMAIESACRRARLTKEDVETLASKLEKEATEKAGLSTRRALPWISSFRQEIEVAAGMPFRDERDHIGEFAVMLDHAARRVSIAHSWIKRAESERQRFVDDAARIVRVPADARRWLDAYCARRSVDSGARGEYRIRRRAREGWDDIVRRWGRSTCTTAADRVEAAREAQDDPEIDKFGDIQLFEALAADNATCVWRTDGTPTPEPLTDYVAATDALAKGHRFKVPAYRHPDPLAHPVFGDFGKSRWEIRFAVHEAARVSTGKRRARAEEEARLEERHAVKMATWDGERLRTASLRWSSKRLVSDLALAEGRDEEAAEVTRADRLGRASARVGGAAPARVAGIFELPAWNGRLQAPRAELDALAERVRKHGWDGRAKLMRDRLGWLVTFSAKLTCAGPFVEYAKRQGLKASRKGEYFPNAEINKGREGNAKLMLSRLPELRVLSVDLGHRFAAACAVWEALSPEVFKEETEGLEVLAGGARPTDIFLHVAKPVADGRTRTVVYRRVGGDEVADLATGEVRPHPAPWARLDRQFLIRLQGEDRPARAASPRERDVVRRLDESLGRIRGEHEPLPRRVDGLISEAVRTTRLALRRHGDAARIAYAFKPDGLLLTPGGGAQPHTLDTRAAAVLEALVRWEMLTGGDRWSDPWAKEQWRREIVPRLGTRLPAPADDADGWARKRRRAAVEEALRPVAASIAAGDTARLHELWAGRWSASDALWRPRLRELRRWLLPRGLRPRADDTPKDAEIRKERRRAARQVGGLSLLRIATIRELYDLQKAYAMQPEPQDLRKNVAAHGDDRFDEFGRSVLAVVERLREQRVKQLASRIVEAALGVGRARTRGRSRDPERPREPVDRPCHAVVIESLRNYRPDELQTRRENRALMSWSAGKVRKYLEESCQLHGLLLREVPPNYTSRQDSRTGLPGVRCDDVALREFRTAPWWRNAVGRARKKLAEGGMDARDQYLVALDDHWGKPKDDGRDEKQPLRIPRNGGDLFVGVGRPGVRGAHGGGRALQADLNAAANIGLRALIDPDFPGRWWYVPCVEAKDAGTAIPRPDRLRGSACFGADPAAFGSLLPARPAESGAVRARSSSSRGRRRPAKSDAETTNYWRDPSAAELRPAAKGGHWLPTAAYWNTVRRHVIDGLLAQAGLGRAVSTRTR